MPKEIIGVADKVLEVDLTSGATKVIAISKKDRRQYLGGKGLALKLLHDHIQPGVDPMGPDNILIIMSGPAAGTPAPAGGRYAVVSKSPLTGIYASSFAGGDFGVRLKKAGYDGIMVRGRAESPVVVSINDRDVTITDATDAWGTDTYEFQAAQKDRGDWITIGPAGENLVRYAVLVSGRRVAGRCGLGAVMGSKNLKGIAVKGSAKIVPSNKDALKKAAKIARAKIKSNIDTGDRLPELGTPQNVQRYGPFGVMPVRNYTLSSFDKLNEISGETIRDRHMVKRHGCVGCPIQCGRTGDFEGEKLISPEYETIALMGSNLLIGDLPQIARWNEKLNRLGMDTISCGNTLGFVMELAEKGIVDAGLSFGDPTGVNEMLEDIAHRRGLGDDLAEGVKRLSEKYGGQEFACHVKGLEMPAYDPRGCTGQGLGYATANCGASHLSGSTHAVEVESYLKPLGEQGKAEFVKFLQDLTDTINSGVFCIQTQLAFLQENFIYQRTPDAILKFFIRNFTALAVGTTDLSDYCKLLSHILGYKISRKDIMDIGERIFNLERLMNCREGVTRADDTLPHRILHEIREDRRTPIQLEKMLKKYYKIRGWDENGIPGQKILRKLGLPEK